MIDYRKRLEAKVAATNAAHKYAVELYPTLAAIFAPYVNQKILKADGTLLAKIASQLPDEPKTPRLHVYHSSGNGYSLVWNVRTTAQDGPDSSTYAEIGLYIGNLTNGVLASLYPAPELRCDYTADEVAAKREAYKAAKRAADALQSALHPFGESDR